MDSKTIIKQLKKALDCKDDKEMRMRVEVVVDVLEQAQFVAPTWPSIPKPTISAQPAQPLQQTFVTPNTAAPRFTMSADGEQLNYERPPET